MQFKVNKGSTIFYQAWWYVVVSVAMVDGKILFECICDNANNTYSWSPDKDMLILSPEQAMYLHSYRQEPLWFDEHSAAEDAKRREIPVDVIAEVLAGLHDHRFKDAP